MKRVSREKCSQDLYGAHGIASQLAAQLPFDTTRLPSLNSKILKSLADPSADYMPKRPRIAVVGSANIDLVTYTDQFPKPGETIFGQKFDLGFGGKGANQAVAAKLCGAEVFMIARVGSDLFGPATIKNFESLGIDASHIRQVQGVSSGVAPIFVDSSGQNRILVVKGANDSLKPADIDAAAWVLKSAECIVLQFEIPLETVYYTVQFARRNKIRCIVNPAPAQPMDMTSVADLDYFVPNETEAETISGIPVRTVDDAKRCADKFLAGGIRRVIITLGANGSLLATKDGMEHVPAFKVKTIDSTGAGDAFIGSFATFVSEGLPELEAVRRALAGQDVTNVLLHAQEKPGPEHGHQQLPVEFGQRMHLLVASEDLVLIASPGQCEVSHAVVPVARFEVEDAAEPFILEEQVPASEVAVQDEPLHVVEVLLIPGVVEAEVVPDLLDELWVRPDPGAQSRGVGGGEEIEDDEGQEADEDEQHHDPEQAPDYVAKHGFPLPRSRC